MPQPTDSTAQLTLHKNLHNAVYDVKAFGAIGDGVTDATAAIQSAVTGSGWPANRAKILVPPGHYVLNGTGIVLDGGGASSTPELLIAADGARFSTTTQSASPMIAITNSIVSATYVTIRGATFLPNASSSVYRTAIKLTNAETTIVDGCTFVGNFGTGIDINSLSNYNRITNNAFFSLSRGINFSGVGNHTVIANNAFGEGLVGNPFNWIDAANGGAPTDNVTVTGNLFYSPGATLAAVRVNNGSGWAITGNTFKSSEVESIRIGGNGSSGGHTIQGNTFSGGKQHDVIVNGGQRNAISGNLFNARAGGVTANTYNAIQVLNTFGGDAGHHNAIIGNVSTDTATALDQFIKLDAGCDYCTIIGNIGAAGFTAAGVNNSVANNITH